jgi:hypothetical protein
MDIEMKLTKQREAPSSSRIDDPLHLKGKSYRREVRPQK